MFMFNPLILLHESNESLCRYFSRGFLSFYFYAFSLCVYPEMRDLLVFVVCILSAARVCLFPPFEISYFVSVPGYHQWRQWR